MSASAPLTGIELINCAKSNAKQGVAVAADCCGYGQDRDRFLAQLQIACQQLGLTQVQTLADLVTPQQPTQPWGGQSIAPETPNHL